ncbi:MAG: hypothetical protein HKN33_12600 [Pyrinomonadaceae bacterium]|nr:hypothetical protein [Pyrinomonadaceae bacterium]
MNNKIVCLLIVLTIVLLRIQDTFFGITGGHQINREKILTDVIAVVSYLVIYTILSKLIKIEKKPMILVNIALMIVVGAVWHQLVQLAVYYFANPRVFQLMEASIVTGIKVKIISFSLVFFFLQIPILILTLIWNAVNRKRNVISGANGGSI